MSNCDIAKYFCYTYNVPTEKEKEDILDKIYNIEHEDFSNKHIDLYTDCLLIDSFYREFDESCLADYVIFDYDDNKILLYNKEGSFDMSVPFFIGLKKHLMPREICGATYLSKTCDERRTIVPKINLVRFLIDSCSYAFEEYDKGRYTYKNCKLAEEGKKMFKEYKIVPKIVVFEKDKCFIFYDELDRPVIIGKLK